MTTTGIAIAEGNGHGAPRSWATCAQADADASVRVLAVYTDSCAGEREIVLRRAHARSHLLIDRETGTGDDARLLAHLAPDEPEINAQIVCEQYLGAPAPRVCRRLCMADTLSLPAWALPDLARPSDGPAQTTEPFVLARVRFAGRDIPELRWTLRPGAPPAAAAPASAMSLRRVIGSLQSYEPARTLTQEAVARHRPDRKLSVATLASELERLAVSPIVLNRLLRGAVEQAVAEGMSLSLIAMRCGRVKRDPRGNISGETSWLGRRLGILPEGGASQPTPWIHSDVLALIARRGLGISPREVELG